MTMITDAQAKRKFLELLNDGEIEQAAEFAVKYALVKAGPEKFARAIYEAAWKYRLCQVISKHQKCECSRKPFCPLVEDLAADILKSTAKT